MQEIVCPCGNRFEIDEGAGADTARCPACERDLRIPDASDPSRSSAEPIIATPAEPTEAYGVEEPEPPTAPVERPKPMAPPATRVTRPAEQAVQPRKQRATPVSFLADCLSVVTYHRGMWLPAAATVVSLLTVELLVFVLALPWGALLGAFFTKAAEFYHAPFFGRLFYGLLVALPWIVLAFLSGSYLFSHWILIVRETAEGEDGPVPNPDWDVSMLVTGFLRLLVLGLVSWGPALVLALIGYTVGTVLDAVLWAVFGGGGTRPFLTAVLAWPGVLIGSALWPMAFVGLASDEAHYFFRYDLAVSRVLVGVRDNWLTYLLLWFVQAVLAVLCAFFLGLLLLGLAVLANGVLGVAMPTIGWFDRLFGQAAVSVVGAMGVVLTILLFVPLLIAAHAAFLIPTYLSARVFGLFVRSCAPTLPYEFPEYVEREAPASPRPAPRSAPSVPRTEAPDAPSVAKETAGRFRCPACSKTLLLHRVPTGGTVRCPSCNTSVAVPAADGGGGGARHERCPSCGAALPDHAVICVRCGVNLRTGEKTPSRRETLVDQPATSASGARLKSAGLGFLVCVVVVFVGYAVVASFSTGASDALSREDRALRFGESAFVKIIGVDGSRPSRFLSDAVAVGIKDNQMTSRLPGAVYVVCCNGPVLLQEREFTKGQIALMNAQSRVILAPPGAEITIPKQTEILGRTYQPGTFVVPPDSRFPEAGSAAPAPASPPGTTAPAPAPEAKPVAKPKPARVNFVGEWEDAQGYVHLDLRAGGTGFLILFLHGGGSGQVNAGGIAWKADGDRLSFHGAVGKGAGSLDANGGRLTATVDGQNRVLRRK